MGIAATYRLCVGPPMRSESKRSPGMYVAAMPAPSTMWQASALAKLFASNPNAALAAAVQRPPAK